MAGLKGFEAHVKALGKVSLWNRIGMGRGLLDAANAIFERSQYYAPKDTRLMVNEAFVESTGPFWNRAAKIVYPVPYSVYVHEDTLKNHAPPTRAKFLEQAVREVGPRTTDYVRQGIEAEYRVF